MMVMRSRQLAVSSLVVPTLLACCLQPPSLVKGFVVRPPMPSHTSSCVRSMKIRATAKLTEPPEQEDVNDESAWYVPPDFSVEDEHLFKEDKVKYIPPDFTIEDDDDELVDTETSKVTPSPYVTFHENDNVNGDNDSSYSDSRNTRETMASSQEQLLQTKRLDRENTQTTTSWMEKNDKFSSYEPERPKNTPQAEKRTAKSSQKHDNERNTPRSFQEDFRGTRVFVQGLSPETTWQQLKDHFRICGNVVFASVSINARTGESKGCGVVQYETTEMAQNAIATMRNYPLEGATLYVRHDVQDERDSSRRLLLRSDAMPRTTKSTIPRSWSCADESTADSLSKDETTAIYSLIRARDEARKRRNYDASDDMREQLKVTFGVHIDDRLKMWWVSPDGRRVPQSISDIKGEGRRWGALKAWRQIPTTPDNDACVNPDLVNGLLTQRDVARREKDFSTADWLLERARTAPDGDLTLRIHDESRTWRVWTEQPPPPRQLTPNASSGSAQKTAAEQCRDIVNKYAPEKLCEVEGLLKKFPGREYNILKKLESRYLKQ